MYIVQHDSARNKKEIILFSGTQTKLRTIKLSKSQNEKKKKNHITYRWDLNFHTNELVKENIRLRDIKDMLKKGKCRGYTYNFFCNS